MTYRLSINARPAERLTRPLPQLLTAARTAMAQGAVSVRLEDERGRLVLAMELGCRGRA